MRINSLSADDVKLILIGLEEIERSNLAVGDAEGIEFAGEAAELIHRLLQQVSDGNLIPQHINRKHKQQQAAA